MVSFELAACNYTIRRLHIYQLYQHYAYQNAYPQQFLVLIKPVYIPVYDNDCKRNTIIRREKKG